MEATKDVKTIQNNLQKMKIEVNKSLKKIKSDVIEKPSDLECIVFTDRLKDVEKFVQILRNARNAIPQGNELVQPVHFEEMKWQPDNKLTPEGREERDKYFKLKEKIGQRTDVFRFNDEGVPVVTRKYYPINNVKDIENKLRSTIINARKPSKLNVVLHYIVEGETTDVNTKKTTVNYRYQTFALTSRLSTTKDLLLAGENCNEKFKEILKKLYGDLDYFSNGYGQIHSREVYVACFAMSTVLYNIPKIGAGGFEELKIYNPWKNFIRINNYSDNLCLFRCLFYHFAAINNTKITGVHQVTAGAKNLYEQFYKQKFNKNYEGFNWVQDEEKFCKQFNVDFDIYEFNTQTQTIKIIESTKYNENSTRGNLITHILESGNEHLMYCSDITKITSYIGCPLCQQMYINTADGRYQLNIHKKTCKGETKQELTTSSAVPYCPQFYKNLLYVFCRIHDLQ